MRKKDRSDERIWDTLWEIVDRGPGEFTYRRAFARLQKEPAGFTLYFATNSAENDILNGGFLQYFSNQTSIGADLAYDWLLRIGANERAEIMLAAMSTLLRTSPELCKFPITKQLKEKLKTVRGDALESLTQSWYKCNESIEVLRRKYVVHHHDELFP